MKAARLVGFKEPLELAEVDVPKVGSHDALVKIKACGVCHTDLHFQDGIMKPGYLPITLGHEMTGQVVEVGKEVDWLKKGTRVVVDYHYLCGRCHNCRVGHEEQCTSYTKGGFNVEGGYAEYAKAPARNLTELPKNISYEDGATLACGGGTVYHAIKSADVNYEDTIVIYGFGGLGILALQVANLTGAKTLVVDIFEEKLVLAQKLGAYGTINSSKQDVVKETKAMTDGLGASKIFELVATPETLKNSLQMLRSSGRLIVLGVLSKSFQTNFNYLMDNKIQIEFQGGYRHWQLEELVQLVKAGKVKPIVSKCYPLKDVNKALDELRQGKIIGRAVVIP